MQCPSLAYLVTKIVLRQRLGSSESGWRRWLNWPSLIWQPQFAMGAVTVVASLLILLHATVGLEHGGTLTLANMNPGLACPRSRQPPRSPCLCARGEIRERFAFRV